MNKTRRAPQPRKQNKQEPSASHAYVRYKTHHRLRPTEQHTPRARPASAVFLQCSIILPHIPTVCSALRHCDSPPPSCTSHRIARMRYNCYKLHCPKRAWGARRRGRFSLDDRYLSLSVRVCVRRAEITSRHSCCRSIKSIMRGVISCKAQLPVPAICYLSTGEYDQLIAATSRYDVTSPCNTGCARAPPLCSLMCNYRSISYLGAIRLSNSIVNIIMEGYGDRFGRWYYWIGIICNGASGVLQSGALEVGSGSV